jgi:hypothetical protein
MQQPIVQPNRGRSPWAKNRQLMPEHEGSYSVRPITLAQAHDQLQQSADGKATSL